MTGVFVGNVVLFARRAAGRRVLARLTLIALAVTGLQFAAHPLAHAAVDACATPPASLPSGAFVSCWDTSKVQFVDDGGTQVLVSSDATSIVLPLVAPATAWPESAYNFVVSWGDGTTSEVTSWDDPDAAHTYATAGQYWVSITGVIEGFSFQGAYNSSGALAPAPQPQPDRLKLISVAQWGTLDLGNSGGYFKGAANVNFTAADAPSLANTTEMGAAFAEATSFNSPLGHWDVSAARSMGDIFAGATSFNQPLAAWGPHLGQVGNFNGAFAGATAFNQDIGGWNVSGATSMYGMFSGAVAFNQDIGGWNVSNVQTVADMFVDAAAFNQDLSRWQTGNVKDFYWMFFRATAFNNGGKPLTWNVSKGENFSNMFESTRAFNQDISSWDLARPPGTTITLHSMFHDADAFNQDLSGWDMSAVTDTSSMFRSTALFNNGGKPLTWGAGTGNITTMNGMFFGSAAFKQDISDWDTSAVQDMREMFAYSTSFNGDISDWQIGSVTAMDDMFADVTLPTDVYGAILTAWAAQTVQPNVVFNAGNSRYPSASAAARATLTSTPKTWNVTDGGAASAPQAPANVTAAADIGEVAVSWSQPLDGGYPITGYLVERSADDGATWTTLASNVDPGVTTYTDASASAGTTYRYAVTGKNILGTGTRSSPSDPVSPLDPAPAAPTGLTAAPGNGSVVLSWTAPSGPVDSYEATATPGNAVCTVAAPDTTCQITGLTNGTPYAFTVTAQNGSGTGLASSAVTATPRTRPSAPTNVQASAGNGQATVTWTAPDNGGAAITRYTVTASPGPRTCTTAGALTCTVAGLTNETAYTFTVTAANTAGTGNPSAASGAVTPAAAPTPPSADSQQPGPPGTSPSSTPSSSTAPAATAPQAPGIPGTTPGTPMPVPSGMQLDSAQDPAAWMQALTPAEVRDLPVDMIATLSPKAFAVMTPRQVRALQPRQASALTSAHLRVIPPRSLRAMQPRTLNACGVRQLRALTDEQVGALRPQQINALSPAKRAALEE